MYKILIQAQEFDGCWLRGIIDSKSIVLLFPGVSLCPELSYKIKKPPQQNTKNFQHLGSTKEDLWSKYYRKLSNLPLKTQIHKKTFEMETSKGKSENFYKFYCLYDTLFIKLPMLCSYWSNHMDKLFASVESSYIRGSCSYN